MILEWAAGMLGICCLANFLYNKRLKEDGSRDQLTNLYNRKYMKNIINSSDRGIFFHVVSCDIDFFKKVNDTYGHDAGDVILKTFAKTLQESFKTNKDYVLRYGGEEFFVFIEDKEKMMSSDLIKERVELVRKKIEMLEMLTKDLDLVKITASFGISSLEGVSLEERMRDSDKKVYQAKDEGRNRVVN